MKVKRNTLLLIACLVWGAAGFNILRLGVLAYPAYLSVLNFVLSALVFAVFQYFIFGRLVKKHTARITGYEEERHFFLKFFDVKSLIIMLSKKSSPMDFLLCPGICHGYLPFSVYCFNASFMYSFITIPSQLNNSLFSWGI